MITFMLGAAGLSDLQGGEMKILMTGGTGFVGTYLSARLTQVGHSVTILARPDEKVRPISAGISFLKGDPTERGLWQDAIPGHDAVVNLAGASIFTRWTNEQKKAILESRITTTRHLVEGLSAAKGKVALFSTSAVGYYGFHEDEELNEESPPGDDFLAGVARAWEEEALKGREQGARVVITRFGIVLGGAGGALGQMIPLFRRFVGGPIGSGRQWFSWIHFKDLCEAFVFLLDHPEMSGPVNLTSPAPVRNKDLAKELGRVLHRPAIVPAPAFMVRLVLGEFGAVILKGQRVMPRRLLDGGFVFQYPDIRCALADIVGPLH
jgi:uncharacterized protein (TIGR01777 family)